MVESKEKKMEGQVGKVPVIMYEFHSKCVASKTVINARSALSWSTKRTVLAQEVLRILMNCSKLLPWERVVENVNEMVLRMQYSGYSKKFNLVPRVHWLFGQQVVTSRDSGIMEFFYPTNRGIPVLVRMLKFKTEVKCSKMAAMRSVYS